MPGKSPKNSLLLRGACMEVITPHLLPPVLGLAAAWVGEGKPL